MSLKWMKSSDRLFELIKFLKVDRFMDNFMDSFMDSFVDGFMNMFKK